MLFEFRSRATGSVTMIGEVGKKVLAVIGKDADPQGIITVAQMPAAIAALEAASQRERDAAAAAPEAAARAVEPGASHDAGHDEDEPDDREDESTRIGFGQRAFPLIEMMRRAHAAGKDITWGV